MARYVIGREYEPKEFDLWSREEGGGVFHTVELARSSQRESVKLLDAVDNATNPDEETDAICAYLDFRLRPVGGGSKKPSTIIRKKWRAEALSPGRLAELLAEVITSDRPF